MRLAFTRTTFRLFLGALSAWLGIATQLPADTSVDFASEIQPILATHCYACHGPDEAEGGLRLSDHDSVLGQHDSGESSVVPGDPNASELMRRLTSHDEADQMPPEGELLSDDQVALIRRWIEEGASWRKHWAFEPVAHPTVPKVSNDKWNENPIDALIFHQLTAANLQPNSQADRATLIRRATYDLTGLPPTPREVKDFEKDPDEDAFKRLVDRLLDSPHYGERWGRHWLDLVRYAETNSFERDGPKPNAWKYRDYVIRSFNEDKPYDQFLREQLAGDELDHVTIESLTATGFYRLGIWDDEPADPMLARYDELDDMITTTGQAFMGLTINCARCHDHKIDPIPQTDYYAMVSVFADVTTYAKRGDTLSNNQLDVSTPDLRKQHTTADTNVSKRKRAVRDLEQIGIKKMSGADQRATEVGEKSRKRTLKKKLKSRLSDTQWRDYQTKRTQLRHAKETRKELAPRNNVLGLARVHKKPPQTFVLFRGSPHSPTDPVSPGVPGILGDGDTSLPVISPPKSPLLDRIPLGRRRAFADWMTDPRHRLVSRVIVNRVWQFHFGRGIVRSSNNFGKLGTPPTHPELLDWLARTFVDDKWSIKSMHRRIMNSRAYQMSSHHHADGVRVDPANDHFWRFNPRRLSAEEVRDSMLRVAGDLNTKVYGPSVYTNLSQEVLAGQSRPGEGWGKSSQKDRNRRSVYIYVKRSLLTPLLSEFDYPDPDQTCESRFITLAPGQSLALMNGEFAHSIASRLSAGLKLPELDHADATQQLIRRIFGRQATDQEIVNGTELLEDLKHKHEQNEEQAMQTLALSVLNWNEFLFVD